MARIATENVTIATRDGAAMGAELARPAAPGVGIVIVGTIYGMDDTMRAIMADWAARGCAVVAPDLFHRTVPGPLGREGAAREKAHARYRDFDVAQGVADLGDAVAWLRHHPACNGKVAAFGYCFGGRYAFLAATRLGVEGAASFHGTQIGLHLDEAPKLACPITIHAGDSDPQIPMAEIEATRNALAGKPDAEVQVHAGAAHGFTGKGRASYHEVADRASTAAAERLVAAIAARATAPA